MRDIGECLPVIVADDVAALVVLFDVPGRREVAPCGGHYFSNASQGSVILRLRLGGPTIQGAP